jgi:hypothetical protein
MLHSVNQLMKRSLIKLFDQRKFCDSLAEKQKSGGGGTNGLSAAQIIRECGPACKVVARP